MDNRIPPVVRKYTEKIEGQNSIDFLSFKDWISKKDNESKDWIIVAQKRKNEKEDYFTFSALASINNDSIERLLSGNEWDIRLDFGKPIFYEEYNKEKNSIFYDSGTSSIIDEVEFRPFVIYREFHGYIPNTFEIIQNFILYHNVFFVPEKNEYQRIDEETGEIHTVILVKESDNNFILMVDSSHLKDYLAANETYLVRYHDNIRWETEDVSTIIAGNFKSIPVVGDSYNFELWIRTDIKKNDNISSSRLHGKDIVTPYTQPNRYHTHSFYEEKDFETYIIDIDEDGKNIESTCNDEMLSNYFTDKGTANSLTDVYFKKDVLIKYYQKPKIYIVTTSDITCLDLWHIPIDITEEDLVQVWLKDLGRLPYKEQSYWKKYNVPPRGTITDHRWNTDFLGIPAIPRNNPIFDFNSVFENIQELFKQKFGATLFLPLKKEDHHIQKTLHLPITDEIKEFDEQIQGLAKMTSDSLNVKLLQKETGIKIGEKNDDKKVNGSIDLLQEFLNKYTTEEYIKEIIYPFRLLQDIRSTGTAHRKGSKYENKLKQHNLWDKSSHDKTKIIVENINSALNEIIKVIDTDD